MSFSSSRHSRHDARIRGRRLRQSSSQQLYRPAASSSSDRQIEDLLSRQQHMTDEEILGLFTSLLSPEGDQIEGEGQKGHPRFVSPSSSSLSLPWNMNENSLMRKAYHRRRAEIRQWTADLNEGKARIDQDGRLVPVTEPPQPPRAHLPPPVPPPGNNNNNNVNPLLGNNNNILHHDHQNNHHNNREQQEEQWLERERREAAAIIARAVQAYRDEGVHENDFELILLDARGNVVDAAVAAAAMAAAPANGRRGGGGGAVRAGAVRAGASVTLRRIVVGVLALVTAFACVILQTLPLLSTPETLDRNFDKLLHELLDVRFLYDHHRHAECRGLNRSPPPAAPSSNKILPNLIQRLGWVSEYDCSGQVLHIPPKHVLREEHELSSTRDEAALRMPYSDGINVSWFLPCIAPKGNRRDEDRQQQNHPLICSEEAEENECRASGTGGELPAKTHSKGLCFRGVHDNLETDVGDILRLGEALIDKGGDHFDIHYDVTHLQQHIPKSMQTLTKLLEERYLVHQQHKPMQDFPSGNIKRATVEPVAFRVLTTGPMDGYGVNLYRSPAFTLNRTNYVGWIQRSKEHNEMAHYSLPIWPLRVPAKRDSCRLMADLEADARFSIRTAIFLTDGSFSNFRGGASLFVDHHPSNDNPKRKIRRGLTVDASKGRVVVSTGGLENLQCRLPTREGLRSVLQIWWDYV